MVTGIGTVIEEPRLGLGPVFVLGRVAVAALALRPPSPLATSHPHLHECSDNGPLVLQTAPKNCAHCTVEWNDWFDYMQLESSVLLVIYPCNAHVCFFTLHENLPFCSIAPFPNK